MEVLLVICSLLGVIGLIFLTYYATKWLNNKFRGGSLYGSSGGIKIVQCIGLAQDKQLVVVRAGNKAMLLGVTASSVTKLSNLDESDMLIIESPPEASSSAGFAESLKKAFSRSKGSDNDADSEITGDIEQEDGYRKNDKDDF